MWTLPESLMKLWNMKVTGVRIVVDSLRTIPKYLGRRLMNLRLEEE